MPNVGKITVDVRTNTAQFEEGLKRARGRFRRFKSAADSSSSSLLKTGKAAVIAELSFRALNATLHAIQKPFAELDKLAKTSDKLGVDSKVLAGLGHAADLTGAGADTLNISLQRLQRRVGDAADGMPDLVTEFRNASDELTHIAKTSSGVTKTLAEIGINVKDLNKLDPAAQFKEVAKAMESVEDANKKVSIAFKLFDADGVKLINTMDLGTKGLDAAAREAESLGIAIDRTELSKIESANDAMDKLSKSFHGLLNQLAIFLAPKLTKLADELTHIMKAINRWAGTSRIAIEQYTHKQDVATKSVEDYSKAVADAEREQEKLNKSQERSPIKDLLGGLEREAASALAGGDRKKLLEGQLGDVGANNKQIDHALFLLKEIEKFNKLNEQRSGIKSVLDGLKSQVMEIGKTAEQLELLKLKTLGASEAQIKLADSMQKTVKAAADAAAKLEKLKDFAKDFKQSIKTVDQARFGNVGEQLDNIRAARKAGLISKEDARRGIAKLRQESELRLKDLQGGSSVENGPVGAIRKGSSDAFSAIQKAIRGEDNPQKEILKEQKKSVEFEKRMLKTLEIIQDHVGQPQEVDF